jgi:putative membrane protein
MKRTLQRSGMVIALGMTALAWAGAVRADNDAKGKTEEVLLKLHHSNQMEIAAGKLAQQKGQSKDVKGFGKTLVTDHTASDKKVMALAKEEKIDLPTSAPMTPDKMEKMKSASGADFDKAFAADMLEDHKKDIAEVKSARDAATDTKLKTLLTATLPVLEKHRDIAQKLTDKLGPSASAAGTNAPAGSK